MTTKRANTLTNCDVQKVIANISKRPTAVEDELKFKMTLLAGLR